MKHLQTIKPSIIDFNKHPIRCKKSEYLGFKATDRTEIDHLLTKDMINMGYAFYVTNYYVYSNHNCLGSFESVFKEICNHDRR